MAIQQIKAKHIVYRSKSPLWFAADFNMNLYRGCCHGCIYCDSRSDCYHNDQFDTVKPKEDALRLMENDLKHFQTKGVISMGAMTDPYNPMEKKLELTRGALKLIRQYGFGVILATKSDLVLRDIDILSDIVKQAPVLIKITITTMDERDAKIIEPYCPSTEARFEALRQLREANLPAGILLMPILPFINDTDANILALVKRAKECRVNFIYPYFGVTLREGQREYFFAKLKEHYPDAAVKYEKYFSRKYNANSYRSKALYGLFAKECIQCGILFHMNDIIRFYKKSYLEQLAFFL